ncbi:hypothetical protein [Nocardiopsis flavescens]
MSDLIDPSGFPVPETLTYSLDLVAAKLKTDGTDLTDTTADITGAWGGLEGIYSAPEDQDLFTVLSPLTGDAEEVSTALSTTSDALSAFAETVRDIKARWATLKTESYAFLNKIEGDDDWRDGGGFLFWKSESPEVAEHNALLDRAAGLLHEYEEAERTCANAITVQFGGTTFIAQRADGSVTAGSGEYVYGFDAPLEGVPMEWGAPQTTDHAWYNDFGDAVGDFFVGIAEDVGGMVGAHGPNGWFSGNWGDNLWDYWGGTVEGLAGLVGVGKDENGEWGWSLETAGNAWKEAAHAVVPWEEWGDRPWYTIGTALLNVGAVVGGALLTATGVGAVVGVPLMAWRGAKILNSVGDSRTPDVPDLADFPGGIDPSLLSRIPRFGDGSFRPLDLSDIDGLDIDSADLGRMNAALERLNNADNGSGLPDGSDGRRTTDTGSDGENGSVPRGAANTNPEPEAENTGNRRNGDSDSDETVDPTADQLDAGQEFLDGVDPESRRRLEEGLNGEQDRWVASQEVPDDASSLNDTPVQRYENEPSRVEADAEQRVEVDSAGNEINARNDGTVNNSVGDGGTPQDTPRGGTSGTHIDSDTGRGASAGGGGGGGGGNGGGGGGLPDGPDDRGSIARTDTNRPEYLPHRSDKMDPDLQPQVLEAIKDVPGVRQLSLNNAELERILGNLTRRPGGQQIADMILDGRVTKIDGFSDIVSSLKNSRDIESKNQEIRLALDIHESGVPLDRIEFRGKDLKTGEDLDVAVLDENGNVLRGYQAYLPEPESTNPLRSAMRKFNKQLPFGTDTQHRVGVVELRMNRSDVSPEDLLSVERYTEERGVNIQLHFQDQTVLYPNGTRIYQEGM